MLTQGQNIAASGVSSCRVRVAGCTLRLDSHIPQDAPLNGSPQAKRFSPPSGPISVDGKFKLLVEPEFGPRALFTTAFRTGIRMAKPPTACLAIGTTAQRGMGTSMEKASPRKWR